MASYEYELVNPPDGDRKRELWIQHAVGFMLFQDMRQYAIDEIGNRTCFLRAPEICVEVASPSNSEEELREKMALYFNASAKEVWFCSVFGEMAFHQPAKVLARSELCPDFPTRI